MKQIHGKLNIDKVDETMYVLVISRNKKLIVLTFWFLGRNFENWMMSWQN
jgi:hypothetical protein